MSDLPLNRDLIDPNFEGYRLSLDPLPILTTHLKDIHCATDSVIASDEYSYDHIKTFGTLNHLTSDSYYHNIVYWTTKEGGIISCDTSQHTIEPVCVFSIDLKDSNAPLTLSLTNEKQAVVSNSQSELVIVDTPDRANQQPWKEVYRLACKEENSEAAESDGSLNQVSLSSLLYDSVTIDNVSYCLTYHIKPSDQQSHNFIHISAVAKQDDGQYAIVSHKSLPTRSSPDYAAFHPDGRHIVLCTPSPLIQPKAAADESTATNGSTEQGNTPYNWYNSGEEVYLLMEAAGLEQTLQKQDVTFTLTSQYIDLKIKDDVVRVKGQLTHKVNVDESTWVIHPPNKLEVILTKSNTEEVWEEVIEGDIMAATNIPPPEAGNKDMGGIFDGKPAYNSQELEECDSIQHDDAQLVCVDLHTKDVTQTVFLGHRQFLFSSPRYSANHSGFLCLRHDVDGIAWQPTVSDDANAPLWKHVATFNAFGYVSASKQSRKYSCACANDYSYSLVVDCKRHLYVYRTSSELLTPLRNRKSGQRVDSVAKQQVVTLDSQDDILGVSARHDFILVLCKNAFYRIKVNEQQQ